MIVMMRSILVFLSCCALFLSASGQEDKAPPTLFSALHEGAVPFLEIDTDMRTLVGKKDREDYQSAILTLAVAQQDTLQWEAQIKARGNNRKQACFFPPLKLKFDKKDLQKAGFQSKNKLKMVVQCRSSDKNGQLVVKEYLIYQLYNLFSPYSYRVQLTELVYHNNRREGKKNADSELQYAFFIEPEDEWELRHEGRLLERERGREEHLERMPFLQLAMFQYMIGNTDWYVDNLHNVQMAKVPEYPKLILVPRDFDYAGLVDSYYAVPHESLPIRHVKERYYCGDKCSPEELEELTRIFLGKREAVLTTVREFPYLDEFERSESLKYLEDFFEILENDKKRDFIFGQ